MAFLFVDAHVHFWDPGRLRYAWLEGNPSIAGRHALPELRKDSGEHAAGQVVFVQAECDRDRFMDEVAWVESLALGEPAIGAIVAFAPINRGAETARALDALARHPLVRGIRHLIQDDPDPDLCRHPQFVEGVRGLGERGLCFELCVRQRDLPAAIDLVSACPGTRFVLDHAGKPEIAAGRLDPWRSNLRALAGFSNVVCKLSGLVTEAGAGAWNTDTLRPFVDHVFDCFGPERVLFGSDWPVVKLAATYGDWLACARGLVERLAPHAKEAVFAGNARRTYGLT